MKKCVTIPLVAALIAALLSLPACESDPFAALRGDVSAEGGFRWNGVAFRGTLTLERSAPRLTVTLTAPAALAGMTAERTPEGDVLTYLGIRREMAAPLEALDLLSLLLSPPASYRQTEEGVRFEVEDGCVTLLSEHGAPRRLVYEGARGTAELWWNQPQKRDSL